MTSISTELEADNMHSTAATVTNCLLQWSVSPIMRPLSLTSSNKANRFSRYLSTVFSEGMRQTTLYDSNLDIVQLQTTSMQLLGFR